MLPNVRQSNIAINENNYTFRYSLFLGLTFDSIELVHILDGSDSMLKTKKVDSDIF